MAVMIPSFFPPDFIKENITKLEKSILTLPKEQINDILKEIYRLAQQEFFEISILNKLLRRIQKKKEYYYQKQFVPRDWVALSSAVITFLLLSIIITLYYYTETSYNWSATHQLLWISILVLIAAFYMIKKIGISMYHWWNPKYHEFKEYYEKLSFIEKKLQQRIKNVHKRYESKNQ